ncbi:MAG: tetratricopeptide repeat protein [Bacteroidota bacterium]
MELSEKETELIRKYFDAELSEDESSELETLENSSDAFREELLTQKAIISSLKAQEKARKMEAVKKLVSAKKIVIDDAVAEESPDAPVIPLEDKSNLEVGSEPKGFPLYYKIAAAVVLLLVASAVFYTQFSGPSPEDLYLSYYEPLDSNVSTRSYTKDEDANPLEAYQKGDYEQAVNVLVRAIEKPDAIPLLRVYLGISLIQTGRDAAAIEIFQMVYNENPNNFTGQYAEWYLALIELKRNPKTAKERFKKIAEQGGIYDREAKEVFEKL